VSLSGELRLHRGAVGAIRSLLAELDAKKRETETYYNRWQASRAKAHMFEDWVRVNHPDCPLLAENIVSSLDTEEGS